MRTALDQNQGRLQELVLHALELDPARLAAIAAAVTAGEGGSEDRTWALTELASWASRSSSFHSMVRTPGESDTPLDLQKALQEAAEYAQKQRSRGRLLGILLGCLVVLTILTGLLALWVAQEGRASLAAAQAQEEVQELRLKVLEMETDLVERSRWQTKAIENLRAHIEAMTPQPK
jgi:hypothetical protein